MDYREEQFLRMQQSDTPKVPFYMSYPMQNLYLTEMEYEKDMDRMKELYPRDVSRIMDVIEDECDKMEYEGSLMFDEYPDRLQLLLLCRRIYNRAKEDETKKDEAKEGEETGEWLQNLIQVMTYQELCQRRRENRSMRRKYY